MGAGKTTVGRSLARLRCCDFIDTDEALEKRTGVSVSHIFEIEGEHGFREREAKLLAEIGRGANSHMPNRMTDDMNEDMTCGMNGGAVVATGGGIILRKSNCRVMRKSGRVIYLRATVELLSERLKDCQSRPLLKVVPPENTITQLLEIRAPLYTAEADLMVESNAGTATAMAIQIHNLLRDYDTRP